MRDHDLDRGAQGVDPDPLAASPAVGDSRDGEAAGHDEPRKPLAWLPPSVSGDDDLADDEGDDGFEPL